MYLSFGFILGSTVVFFLGMPPRLVPLEVLLGSFLFRIFPFGNIKFSCVHFLVWLVVLLVLYSIVHELNTARHELLHLWRTLFPCWIFDGGDSTVSDINFTLFQVIIPYGICSVPFLVLCTSCIICVVPIMLYCLAYYESLFLSLLGIMVCICNQILHICECRLIGGE